MSEDEQTADDLPRAANERLLLLEALARAAGHPHHVLDVLLEPVDVADARSRLQRELGFSEIQAMAVLDLQFRRMAGLERRRITDDQQARGHRD